MSGRKPLRPRLSPTQIKDTFVDRVCSGISRKEAAKGLASGNAANYAEYLLRDPVVRNAIISRLQHFSVSWQLLLLRAKEVLKQNTSTKTEIRAVMNKKGEKVGEMVIPLVDRRVQVAAAKVIFDTLPKVGIPFEEMAEKADHLADKKTLVRAVLRNSKTTTSAKAPTTDTVDNGDSPVISGKKQEKPF